MKKEEIPLSKIDIPIEDMDYLLKKYSLSNHGIVMEFAVRLLADLSKCNDMGWNMVLAKAHAENGKAIWDENYTYALFNINNIRPDENGFMRIDPNVFEEKLKLNK